LIPLSRRSLEALREYWKTEQTPHYLFPGKTHDDLRL
jgi:hypothetical protein